MVINYEQTRYLMSIEFEKDLNDLNFQDLLKIYKDK